MGGTGEKFIDIYNQTDVGFGVKENELMRELLPRENHRK